MIGVKLKKIGDYPKITILGGCVSDEEFFSRAQVHAHHFCARQSILLTKEMLFDYSYQVICAEKSLFRSGGGQIVTKIS